MADYRMRRAGQAPQVRPVTTQPRNVVATNVYRPPVQTMYQQRPPDVYASGGGGVSDLNGRPYVRATGSPRADYNAAAAEFTENVVLFPSSLRIESGALAAVSSVQFNLQQAIVQSINQIQLSQNDAFVAQRIFVGIGRRFTANSVSSKIIHTFPNDKVFTAANELPALAGFYNGSLNIQINDIQYGANIDMLNFLHADMAQQAQAISSVATTGVQGFSKWQGKLAFIELTPQVIFNGLSKNIITVNFPDSLNLAAAGGSENTAVLIVRGLLAQNGAAQRTRR